MKLKIIPAIVAAITIVIATVLEAHGTRMGPPPIPVGWIFFREMVGPLVSVLFPWNGWVFLIPLIVASLARWHWRMTAMMCLTMSIVMGVADTVVSFNDATTSRLAKGMLFYILVFGATWGAWQVLVIVYERVQKCLQ